MQEARQLTQLDVLRSAPSSVQQPTSPLATSAAQPYVGQSVSICGGGGGGMLWRARTTRELQVPQ